MHDQRPSNADFLLRDYEAIDFDALWQLDQICFVRGIAYSKSELKHFLQQEDCFCIVAQTGEAVRGFIVVEHDSKGTGRIITIDVHPDARRSGLGTLLMRASEGRLVGLGARRIVLEVAVDNLSAISFYKRHDYSVAGTIPRYYNRSLDALRMEKPLILRQ